MNKCHLCITIKNKFFILILFIIFFQNSEVFSQTERSVSTELATIGFENLRTTVFSEKIYISLENNIFRWDPLAISTALDIISNNVGNNIEIHLLILKNGIPHFLVTVKSFLWKSFRNETINKNQIAENLSVSWNSTEAWQILKHSETINKNIGKTDIVLYPQLYYENTQLRKIYETQINIAPSIEFSVWKGNKFTGQIIFPLHNELGYEGNFIRPGYITFSQDFKLDKLWFGNISVGNFNNIRYGIGIQIWHPFRNENWNVEINAGLTGYSHFFDNNWTHGSLKTFTWATAFSWYFSRFNMVLKGGAAQYIYGDKGLFASCTRSFGENTIGFYAQYNEHNFNAGFNASIPFPFKKRMKRNRIRINIPNHYEINYNSGTELFYAQKFNTNIGENSIKKINFTKSTEYEIINLLKYTP